MAGVQDVDRAGDYLSSVVWARQDTERRHVQFRAKSWGGNNDPVTRSRLATQIAKRVVEFLGVSTAVPLRVVKCSLLNPFKLMEEVESTDMVWKVGRGHITAKDLVLVSLTQVSKGSWQPLLRLLP